MIRSLSAFVHVSWLVATVHSSCNDDQKSRCLEYYRKHTSFWHKDEEMNECRQKRYSEFTHLCTIANYLPGMDYCCCVTDDKSTYAPNDELADGFKSETSRDAETLVMCCRYHQDWNKFRCQKPVDAIDTKLFQLGVLASNFEPFVSALLCYGFFIFVITTFVAIIICLVRRRSIRRAKARKNNTSTGRANVSNMRGTNCAAPLYDSYGEIPPPYSAGDYFAPPYERQNLRHPLISGDESRLQPSAPLEEDILLRSLGIEYHLDGPREDGVCAMPTSAATAMTSVSFDASLSSSEDNNSSTRLIPNHERPLNKVPDVELNPNNNNMLAEGTHDQYPLVPNNEIANAIRPQRRNSDYRTNLNSSQQGDRCFDRQNISVTTSHGPSQRLSPPPSYEDSVREL